MQPSFAHKQLPQRPQMHRSLASILNQQIIAHEADQRKDDLAPAIILFKPFRVLDHCEQGLDSLLLEAEGVRDRELRVWPFREEEQLVVFVAVVVDAHRSDGEGREENQGRAGERALQRAGEEILLFFEGMQERDDLVQVVLQVVVHLWAD